MTTSQGGDKEARRSSDEKTDRDLEPAYLTDIGRLRCVATMPGFSDPSLIRVLGGAFPEASSRLSSR
jgi:hypothetical protein